MVHSSVDGNFHSSCTTSSVMNWRTFEGIFGLRLHRCHNYHHHQLQDADDFMYKTTRALLVCCRCCRAAVAGFLVSFGGVLSFVVEREEGWINMSESNNSDDYTKVFCLAAAVCGDVLFVCLFVVLILRCLKQKKNTLRW